MNSVDQLKKSLNLSILTYHFKADPQEGPGSEVLRPAGKFSGGFTWLEVLATLAVLILGCLAVLNLQKSTLTGNNQTDHLTIVNLLAESQLELLKAMDYDELGEVKNRVTKVNRYGETCREESDDTCYELNLNIDNVKSGYNGRLIHLEVRWKDRGGREMRTFEMAISDFTI